ncbi:MAG: amino acid--tRNA ligase-related protein [Treponemataceae bacterium]
MDLELLQFRSAVMQNIRSFFLQKSYLELDTPILSKTAIPETCIEVFKTEYIFPWKNEKQELYLLPSPEFYIKKIIAQHKVSVFQLGKCFRNCESIGNLHNPEFTMLEYYTLNAHYKDSLLLTENMIESLLPPQKNGEADFIQNLRPPFVQITMNEAFKQITGKSLDDLQDKKDLILLAKTMDLSIDPSWEWDDLYELIFVHSVEPNLSRLTNGKPIFLIDYPSQVACLAKNKSSAYKERWELYINGIELANCYSEETNPQEVQSYFEKESLLKNQSARIPHDVEADYWKIFTDFPTCSGVALGFDRLLMVLCNKKSIESVLINDFI